MTSIIDDDIMRKYCILHSQCLSLNILTPHRYKTCKRNYIKLLSTVQWNYCTQLLLAQCHKIVNQSTPSVEIKHWKQLQQMHWNRFSNNKPWLLHLSYSATHVFVASSLSRRRMPITLSHRSSVKKFVILSCTLTGLMSKSSCWI